MQIEENKKELIFFKEIEPGKLMQELHDSIPELRPRPLSNDIYEIKLRIFTIGNKLILWVPENMDVQLINQIVTNHQLTIKKRSEE